MFDRLANTLLRFHRETRGNIAVIFTLALIPIFGGVGAAVDYSRAVQVRTKLQAAADSAILLAVSKNELNTTPAAMKTKAEAFYKAQALSMGVSTSNISIDVTDSVTGRFATATFSSAVNTEIAKVIGVNSINVGGTVKASGPIATYIDFYLLLDNTPSMGVAATPADVIKMEAATGGCAFACHDLSGSQDYYKIAKQKGVQTRIDVVRSATAQLMDTAATTEVVNDQFRMAIYQFSDGCDKPGPSTIASLTANLSNAKAQANKIDLMTMPYQGYNNDQCTDFDGIMTTVKDNAPLDGGDGTKISPQKYLFLVSDGVSDAYYPSTCSKPTSGGRCQEPFKPSNCTALKNRGIKIAVLYTTYLALPTNGWYNQWIAPFNAGPYGPSKNSEIAKNMEACASPGFYFEVSPTQGIADAMEALFRKAVAQARLTT